MPKKTTKAGLIDRIVARFACLIDEAAEHDSCIARVLMIQRLDRQYWRKWPKDKPLTLFPTAHLDTFMGGVLEQLFDVYKSWLPETSAEDKTSMDILPLFANFSPERIAGLRAGLIDRLIERFWFPFRIDLGSKSNDPADMRGLLQTLDKDQLERIACVLKQAVEDPKKQRPIKKFWDECLANFIIWLEIRTNIAEKGMKPSQARSEFAYRYKLRNVQDDFLLTQFRRTNALVSNFVSLVSVQRVPNFSPK